MLDGWTAGDKASCLGELIGETGRPCPDSLAAESEGGVRNGAEIVVSLGVADYDIGLSGKLEHRGTKRG